MEGSDCGCETHHSRRRFERLVLFRATVAMTTPIDLRTEEDTVKRAIAALQSVPVSSLPRTELRHVSQALADFARNITIEGQRQDLKQNQDVINARASLAVMVEQVRVHLSLSSRTSPGPAPTQGR